MESARLDGAGEWRILFEIILPLSKPIIATLTLFYLVDRWNEWYNACLLYTSHLSFAKYSLLRMAMAPGATQLTRMP